MDHKNKLNRREFIKQSTVLCFFSHYPPSLSSGLKVDGNSEWYTLSDWESLNPGYWSTSEKTLRRRLSNVGDRARNTGFPFHYETHRLRSGSNSPVGIMDVDYDPSQPLGIMWNRKWRLTGSYKISAEGRNKSPGSQSASG